MAIVIEYVGLYVPEAHYRFLLFSFITLGEAERSFALAREDGGRGGGPEGARIKNHESKTEPSNRKPQIKNRGSRRIKNAPRIKNSRSVPLSRRTGQRGTARRAQPAALRKLPAAGDSSQQLASSCQQRAAACCSQQSPANSILRQLQQPAPFSHRPVPTHLPPPTSQLPPPTSTFHLPPHESPPTSHLPPSTSQLPPPTPTSDLPPKVFSLGDCEMFNRASGLRMPSRLPPPASHLAPPTPHLPPP